MKDLTNSNIDRQSPELFSEIRELIVESRNSVAQAVNSALTLLYWKIDERINKEILRGEKADYGKQIVVSLSQQLTMEYGRGWSQRQLWHCLRFAESFPDIQIVHTLSSQLSWSH